MLRKKVVWKAKCLDLVTLSHRSTSILHFTLHTGKSYPNQFCTGLPKSSICNKVFFYIFLEWAQFFFSKDLIRIQSWKDLEVGLIIENV